MLRMTNDQTKSVKKARVNVGEIPGGNLNFLQCNFLVLIGLSVSGGTNPSITNGCVDQQQQRPAVTVAPLASNGSLPRPVGNTAANGGHLQLHAINSTVGTHV